LKKIVNSRLDRLPFLELLFIFVDNPVERPNSFRKILRKSLRFSTEKRLVKNNSLTRLLEPFPIRSRFLTW
jgi:hypothetical protein